jgi:hypothetical protein
MLLLLLKIIICGIFVWDFGCSELTIQKFKKKEAAYFEVANILSRLVKPSGYQS